MRRVLAVVVTVVACSAVAVSPAFANGNNPTTSCGVGSEVSVATHQAGGLGRLLHQLGARNVGEVIQPFHEEVKEVC